MASIRIESGANRPRPNSVHHQPSKSDLMISRTRSSDPALALAHAVVAYHAPGLGAAELASRGARALEIAHEVLERAGAEPIGD